jgi:hypothetical protein
VDLKSGGLRHFLPALRSFFPISAVIVSRAGAIVAATQYFYGLVGPFVAPTVDIG